MKQPILSTAPRTPANIGRRVFLILIGTLAIALSTQLPASQAAANDPLVRTSAGSGAYGFAGDNGNAANAFLATPTGVAVDADGNLYIADSYNNRVRKVSPQGIITTVAGTGIGGDLGDGGNATQAQLDTPTSVAVDRSGNLYIADTLNNVIRKVDTTGKITRYAGDYTDGYSGDNGAATAAKLSAPQGITVDDAGNLYISDTFNDRVRKVTPQGIITTFAGNGTAGYSGDNGVATSARLDSPDGVAVDRVGNLYIADTQNFVIRKVDTTGKITTFAGNGQDGYSVDNVPATQAKLSPVRGVAVDASGRVFIGDPGNDRIRMVDTNGIISTIAGNGATGFTGDGVVATQTALNEPCAVAVNPYGVVYVADSYNDRIRILKSTQLQLFGLSSYLLTTGSPNTTVRVFGTGMEGSTATINGQAASATLDAASGNLDVTVPATMMNTAGTLPIKVTAANANAEKTIVVATAAQISASSVTSVGGASYAKPLVPEGIASMFGTGMATQSVGATDTPVPTTLGGTRIFVNGTPAPLFYVAPTQINYQLPDNLTGAIPAKIVVVSGSGTVFQEQFTTAYEAPGIFTANSAGTGGPAALWTMDGIAHFPVTNPDGSLNAIPVNAYLVLFAVGVRRAPDLNTTNQNGAAEVTTATIGTTNTSVAYAGKQPQYVGLDQVNVQIPASLAGRGQTAFALTVNGKTSNTVQIRIQ